MEGSTAGTLARMTVAGSVSASMTKRSSLGRASTPASMQSSGGGGKADSGQAENLAQDMADLMHDFDVVSSVGALVGSLKCPYPGLTTDTTATILAQIQASIRQKDEEMSWLDKSCLQLAVKRRDKVGTQTFRNFFTFFKKVVYPISICPLSQGGDADFPDAESLRQGRLGCRAQTLPPGKACK